MMVVREHLTEERAVFGVFAAFVGILFVTGLFSGDRPAVLFSVAMLSMLSLSTWRVWQMSRVVFDRDGLTVTGIWRSASVGFDIIVDFEVGHGNRGMGHQRAMLDVVCISGERKRFKNAHSGVDSGNIERLVRDLRRCRHDILSISGD